MWVAILFFIGHEPVLLEQEFFTQQSCEKAATALVLATYDAMSFPYATPPFTCKKLEPAIK